MGLIDFGMNSYQYQIDVRAHWISNRDIRTIVRKLAGNKGEFFSEISLDETSGNTVLSKGRGNEEAPFFQMTVRSSSLRVWAGWHVPFEKWVTSRESLLLGVLGMIDAPAGEHIARLISQYSITYPEAKLRSDGEVEELSGLRGFFREFLPDHVMAKSNLNLVFSDWDETDAVLLSRSGDRGQTFVLVHERRRVSEKTLQEAVKSHCVDADRIFEKYTGAALSLFRTK